MARRARAGFTLIEMMAVVAIIGMIFALGLPRLSSSRWRALGDAAEDVAASLEFARQRAIMTGIPHRVLIDLENGAWRVEWLVSQEQALAAASGGPAGTSSSADAFAALAAGDEGAEPDPDAPIALHPPARAGIDYYPIASRLGSVTRLEETLYFVGLEGPSGWIEGGQVQIVFESDGTSEFVLLELADADDRHLTLEIEPMLERIRRREGTARS